jgi:hypothetical protein
VHGSASTARSHAEVSTPLADRWVRRLAADLVAAQEVEDVVDEAGWTVLRLTAGSCALTGSGQAVLLEARAPDDATLGRVQDVVGGRLERLGATEGVRVVWESGEA